MRLWLDDIREPWKHGFIACEWAHTAEEAIERLKQGDITLASLDHDLAPEHYEAPNAMTHSYSDQAGYELLLDENCSNGSRLRLKHWRRRSQNKHCGDKCGCAVVKWMEENNVWPRDGVVVHSQNPAGRARMQMMIDKHYLKEEP